MILGADPDQLNTVAQRISSRADDYDNADEHINYWLRRMDWHGPQADAFRSLYHSRMRPQLQAVATELRQAASELRANAAQQQAASGEKRGNIPGCALPPDGGNWVENLLDDARRIKDIIDSFSRPPFPVLPFPFPGLPFPGLPIVGLPFIGPPGIGLFGSAFGSTALNLFAIGDFLRMHGGKPAGYLVGRLARPAPPVWSRSRLGKRRRQGTGCCGRCVVGCNYAVRDTRVCSRPRRMGLE